MLQDFSEHLLKHVDREVVATLFVGSTHINLGVALGGRR